MNYPCSYFFFLAKWSVFLWLFLCWQNRACCFQRFLRTQCLWHLFGELFDLVDFLLCAAATLSWKVPQWPCSLSSVSSPPTFHKQDILQKVHRAGLVMKELEPEWLFDQDSSCFSQPHGLAWPLFSKPHPFISKPMWMSTTQLSAVLLGLNSGRDLLPSSISSKDTWGHRWGWGGRIWRPIQYFYLWISSPVGSDPEESSVCVLLLPLSALQVTNASSSVKWDDEKFYVVG